MTYDFWFGMIFGLVLGYYALRSEDIKIKVKIKK